MTIKHFTFDTGRLYNGPQVLEITVQYPEFGDDMIADGVAVFIDNSRGISGRVHIWVFESDKDRDIGRSVLKEYDAGAYELI